MYEYIKGKYIGIIKDYIILENNNIGYKVFTSGSTISKLPKVDEDVLLYIEQIVREDFIGLYGFKEREELDLFKLLISISGVGPKAALSLLSISTVNNLKYSIFTEDYKHLCRAPGIGKKIAGRIILELKDKIKNDDIEDSKLDLHLINDCDYDKISNLNDALSALLALGYSEKEAENSLKNVDKDSSVENIIKEALKILMG